MQRIGAIFVAVCMVLIAMALGAVLFLLFGMTATEAAVAGVAALCALALYNTISTRMRDRVQLTSQIADLSRGTADLARQVAEMARRMAVLEGPTSRALGGSPGLVAELGEIGTLVKQLAETVAAHDTALAAKGGAKPEPEREPAVIAPAPLIAPEQMIAPMTVASAVAEDRGTAVIRAAIEADRVDLYLQPIVTLPQRKVRYYEALTRLRDQDGRLIQPPEFLGVAEAAGLIARIDNLILFRCVQVLRRLQIKNREVGLFCNISPVTLNDPQIFPQMLQFMEANRALSSSLVLEFRQSAWRDMGPLETEGLAALREMGFRFCMDQVTDLRLEPRDLADRGVRHVKVPASLLLSGATPFGTDIHAADLSNLLGRHGINLIGERIETEAEVVDLLEFDLRYGQGFLFSAPRPVKIDALQGAAEPSDAPAATSAPAISQNAAPPVAASARAAPSVLPAALPLGG